MSSDYVEQALLMLRRTEEVALLPQQQVILQGAQVQATLALVEQQRIANKIAVGQIAQLGAIARVLTGPNYPTDPAIPVDAILTRDEEGALEP